MSAAKSPMEHAHQTIMAFSNPLSIAKFMAVSWVLSPSSATKNVQKMASGANLNLLLCAFSSSSSSERRVVAAKNKKAPAARNLMSQRGMNLLTTPPARTASALRIAMATTVPRMMSLSLYFDVSANSISWVLSPISIMKVVKRIVKKRTMLDII